MEAKTLHIIGLTAIIIAFAHIGQMLVAGIRYIVETGQSVITPLWLIKSLVIILLLVLIYLMYRTVKIYLSFKGGARADKVILMTAMIVSFSLFAQLMIQIRTFALDYKNIDPGLTDVILRVILGVLFLAVLVLGYKTVRLYNELK